MSALSELLSTANTAHLSARALSRLARERGHSINHDTVARYLRGAHGTPDETTLRGFADVLDLPLRELRAAADLPSEQIEPYAPPIEASRLSRRQRRAVDEIIRAMVEPTRAARSADARAAADSPAPTDTPAAGLRAARHGEPEDDDA